MWEVKCWDIRCTHCAKLPTMIDTCHRQQKIYSSACAMLMLWMVRNNTTPTVHLWCYKLKSNEKTLVTLHDLCLRVLRVELISQCCWKKEGDEEERWYVSAQGPQWAVVLLVLITPITHTHLVDSSEEPIRRAGQVNGKEKPVLKFVAISTIQQRDGVLWQSLHYISINYFFV